MYCTLYTRLILKFSIIKKVVFLAVLLFLFIIASNVQIYNLQLAGREGIGTIYYPYGYYQGNTYNGFANGQKTFFRFDDSFYIGCFYAGFYHGAGLLATRMYGYISGCWNVSGHKSYVQWILSASGIVNSQVMMQSNRCQRVDLP